MQFLNNRMTQQTYFMGAWASKGEIAATGQKFDSCKVRLMCIDKVAGNGSALGFEDLSFGSSDNFSQVSNLDVMVTGPVLVEVEVEERNTKIVDRNGQSKQGKERVIVALRLVKPTETRPAEKKVA